MNTVWYLFSSIFKKYNTRQAPFSFICGTYSIILFDTRGMDESRLSLCVFQKWRCATTPLSHSWSVLFLTDTLGPGFIGQRQSRRQPGSAGCVVNLAPMEMCSRWNELCGPASAGKSQRLTLHPIRAFPNVEWSDSRGSSSGANYTASQWQLSDPLPALTVLSIIYSCKHIKLMSCCVYVLFVARGWTW